MDEIKLKESQLTKLLQRIILTKYENYVVNLSVEVSGKPHPWSSDSELSVDVYLSWRPDIGLEVSDEIGGDITKDITDLTGYIISGRFFLGVFIVDSEGGWYDNYAVRNYDPWD